MDVGAGGAGSSPTTRFCTIDPGMHGGKPRRHRDNSQSSIKFSSGFALRYCNELNTRSHIPAWPRKSAANATCDLQQSHDSRRMIHTSPPCPCRPGMPEPIIEPGALPRGLEQTCRAQDLHRCARGHPCGLTRPHIAFERGSSGSPPPWQPTDYALRTIHPLRIDTSGLKTRAVIPGRRRRARNSEPPSVQELATSASLDPGLRCASPG